MSSVILAKQIHETTGAACHPWEVEDYPDDWLTAIKAIAYDVPARIAKKAERKWRQKSK